jgi:hypothetical protein
MIDNTLGDLTNKTDVLNSHSKENSASRGKNDNAREALKDRLNFNQNSAIPQTKTSTSANTNHEKENDQSINEKGFYNEDNTLDDPQKSESASNRSQDTTNDSSGVLTERRAQVQYDLEDDDEDSPEEQEDESERENAMNKLKALLGSAKQKKKSPAKSSQPTPSLRKSVSQNDGESHDFMHMVEKMRLDLFHKLDIQDPEDDDYDEEVSKIFYEGRNGQEYTVSVLQKFFETLKGKAKQFVQSSKPVEKQRASYPKYEENQEERVSEDKESDKERIKRKLKESSKQSSKHNSNKESLKNLLSNSKSAKKTPVNDINDVIKVDSQVLNYGNVNPGKLLGSIVVISNVSSEEQTIELSLDSSTEVYDRDEIMKNKEFGYIEEVTSDEVELTEKETNDCLTDETRSDKLEEKRRYIVNSENKLD